MGGWARRQTPFERWVEAEGMPLVTGYGAFQGDKQAFLALPHFTTEYVGLGIIGLKPFV